MVTKEAPLPNQAITSNEMKNFESIEIENNNTKYLLKLFNNENNLGFLIEKINLFPKNEYYYESSLENLQSLNRFFLFFENIKQVKLGLIKMSIEKNLTITEEKDKCKINIINQINNTQFSINIPIKKKI